MLHPSGGERIRMMQRPRRWREDAPLIRFRLRVTANEIGDACRRALYAAPALGIRHGESSTGWAREGSEVSDDGERCLRALVLVPSLHALIGLGPGFEAPRVEAVAPTKLRPTRDPGKPHVSGEARQ